MTRPESSSRPVLFGEVLFDVFPDRAVLGGAPFNVAWNLQGLGLSPLVVSRVGSDDPGRRVIEGMERWGMDTAGVQTDPHHPTGEVRVDLEDGQPRFHILADRAYDHIEAAAAEAAVRRSIEQAGERPILYHGTLAARSETSRAALEALKSLGLPVFLDVNLRAPWWEREAVWKALRDARWVKLNQDELEMIRGEKLEGENEIERAAAKLREELGLELLIVTRGADGALAVRPGGEVIDCEAVPVDAIADTVGAGDGFAAVIIFGLAKGWPLRIAVRRAVEFARRLCELRGATTEDPPLYRGFADRWEEETRG